MLAAANLTQTENTPDPAEHLPERDEELRKIAKAGREWMMTIGRKVDMESAWTRNLSRMVALIATAAYVYRLCLEWARLWADDREARTYRG